MSIQTTKPLFSVPVLTTEMTVIVYVKEHIDKLIKYYYKWGDHLPTKLFDWIFMTRSMRRTIPEKITMMTTIMIMRMNGR